PIQGPETGPDRRPGRYCPQAFDVDGEGEPSRYPGNHVPPDRSTIVASRICTARALPALTTPTTRTMLPVFTSAVPLSPAVPPVLASTEYVRLHPSSLLTVIEVAVAAVTWPRCSPSVS